MDSSNTIYTDLSVRHSNKQSSTALLVRQPPRFLQSAVASTGQQDSLQPQLTVQQQDLVVVGVSHQHVTGDGIDGRVERPDAVSGVTQQPLTAFVHLHHLHTHTKLSLTVRLHVENNLVVCTWGSNMTHTKSLFSRSVLKV